VTASILTRRVDIAVVLAALFLFGVNEAFGDTTTATLLPMLVEKPDLGIANSRALTGVIVWNQLAGPPVGAALFAAGMALPFVTESVCVLAGVMLIWKVRLPVHGASGQHARVRDDIREGWRWLWAHAAVRTLAITIFTFNVTFGAAWSGAGPVRARAAGHGRARLRADHDGNGGRRPAGHRVLRLAGAACTAGRHHARRPDHRDFQGRVSSVYLTGVVGGIVIGSALGGLVASVWGITAPFWFAFAGSALILAVIWRSLLDIAHSDEQARASARPSRANLR
jgi:hypothetical protein